MIDKLQAEALALRAEGWKQKEIAELMEIPLARVWRLLNLERARKMARETAERRRARGGVPLYSVPKDQLYSVYVHGVKPNFGAK